jgi:hypothetical protein
MGRSNVLSLPLKLVFPGSTFCLKTTLNAKLVNPISNFKFSKIKKNHVITGANIVLFHC